MATRQSFLSTVGLIKPRTKHRPTNGLLPSSNSPTGGTKPDPRTSSAKGELRRSRPPFAGLAASQTLTLFALFSLLFTGVLALAFVGARDGDEFKVLLDDQAINDPGILLLGENVDVDVDEPSITVRWSLVACGRGVFLEGSGGVHGSADCGLPKATIDVYVDDDEDATLTYDPEDIPFLSSTSTRRHIQDLSQFDSDYILDVHEAYLYPLDRYALSSTMYAVNHETNTTIPIQRLKTIAETTSFSVSSSDTATYHGLADGHRRPSREIMLKVQRPAGSQTFALLLWATNWMLTHISVGLIVMALKHADCRQADSPALAVLAILLAIPKLRESMPDDPGLDGVLIVDAIGYFPQMVISGACAVTLLFLAAKRELEVPNTVSRRSMSHDVDVEMGEAPTTSVDFGTTPTGKSWSEHADSREAPGGRISRTDPSFWMGHSRHRRSLQVDARFIIEDEQ
ncbi:hypothetical protein OF83DRAFT_1061455 [Amylostereum chailletii]|nr:hypothetical protein OF83DRAFT_1061455 [Amylostereum chailletii]